MQQKISKSKVKNHWSSKPNK